MKYFGMLFELIMAILIFLACILGPALVLAILFATCTLFTFELKAYLMAGALAWLTILVMDRL